MEQGRYPYQIMMLLMITIITSPGCLRRKSLSIPAQQQDDAPSVEQIAEVPASLPAEQAAEHNKAQADEKKEEKQTLQVAANDFHAQPAQAQDDPVKPQDTPPSLRYRPHVPTIMKDVPLEERLIKVNFENEDLASMLNHFAELQQKNIIFPQGADAITQKVTFRLPQEIPLKEVNRYLDTFLDLSGYSRVPHGNFYRIVKTDANIARESLPLYVGVNPAELPSSDERIRVIYYLKNLRVPENAHGTEPITIILNDMLSPQRSFIYDTKPNALIIADKANNIKAVMKIILDLDTIGSKDIIRAVPLYNTTAETLAQIITTQILAMTGEEQAQLALIPGASRAEAGKYFVSGTRVIADPRTNSLLVMGREPAVERMQDFIRDYLDAPTDSGKSIIHFYELQYLDAEKFAPILQKIVSEQISASGQATQQNGGSAYHFFDGVIVEAEKVLAEKVEEKQLLQTETSIQTILKGEVYRGGNRIIVMALNQDWTRIERLIAELDKPQLQALIQVMILEFTVNKNKILGAQTRNPAWLTLPKGLNFQAAHLSPPIMDGPVTVVPPTPPNSDLPSITYTNPTTVAADLLRLFAGSSLAGLLTSIPSNIGSTIFSVNDPSSTTPGTWTLIQWLSQFGSTKVVSHPYLVVVNGSRGEENVSTIKRVAGPAQTGEGGAISTKLIDIEASLKVAVVPRASSEDRVNMQISVVIQSFIGTQANLTTREVHTNVNLSSGDTIVLGGLTQDSELENEKETPFLGRIPILRLLFSSNSKNTAKTNLLVLISPTIVQPKIRSGINQFSSDEAKKTHDQLRDSQLFGSLKDPVSYFFFDDKNNPAINMLDEYLADSVTGDFVFKDPVIKDPSNHHCAQDVVLTDPNITTTAAHSQNELKALLATEENPLLTGHRSPKQGVLNSQ